MKSERGRVKDLDRHLDTIREDIEELDRLIDSILALSNILENAVKFAPHEGRLLVRVYPEGDFLTISIMNSFGALSREDLEKIFEPFYRIEGSGESGSGLGLAITRKIIERHSGTIEATNSPEGLEIKIRLPRGSRR